MTNTGKENGRLQNGGVGSFRGGEQGGKNGGTLAVALGVVRGNGGKRICWKTTPEPSKQPKKPGASVNAETKQKTHSKN